MAFFPPQSRTILFGGQPNSNPAPNEIFDDTWAWDGNNWVIDARGAEGQNWLRQSPATSPSARRRLDMAYDAFGQRMVLFGGARGDIVISLGDTWVWDGQDWEKRVPLNTPPKLDGRVVAYDVLRAELVLHGGWGCPTSCGPQDLFFSNSSATSLSTTPASLRPNITSITPCLGESFIIPILYTPDFLGDH